MPADVISQFVILPYIQAEEQQQKHEHAAEIER
jgi:hypothetical protein